jgi:hypothetical protein
MDPSHQIEVFRLQLVVIDRVEGGGHQLDLCGVSRE